jgi:hypothetical protein
MIYHVIIKGNKFVASKAASARNVPLVFDKELPAWDETLGRVSAEHVDKLTAWFAEDVSQPFNAGFHPGALLYYAPHSIDYFTTEKKEIKP